MYSASIHKAAGQNVNFHLTNERECAVQCRQSKLCLRRPKRRVREFRCALTVCSWKPSGRPRRTRTARQLRPCSVRVMNSFLMRTLAERECHVHTPMALHSSLLRPDRVAEQAWSVSLQTFEGWLGSPIRAQSTITSAELLSTDCTGIEHSHTI